MVATTVGLSTHIWNNNLRCILLLAFYPVLILGVFWLIIFALDGVLFSEKASQNFDFVASTRSANQIALDFVPMIITGVAIWFTIAWFSHTRIIRSMAHSHPVTRKEEPELYNLLENLCISQGMPMPRLEIIETHARNAFASGISNATFTVTVTRGLMHSLTKDELEAVLAHELAHILNRDVRLLIVTIIFTGLFGFLSQIIWHNLRYSLFYGGVNRRRSNGNNNNGGLFVAMIIVAVILSIGYFISLLLRFALSRRREYMADAGAVEMTKNPEAMMSALMRIAGRDQMPNMSEDIAMMCIENHKSFLGVFATHPPIDHRIKAIAQVTGMAVPDAASLPPVGHDQSFGGPYNRGNRSKNPWESLRGR